MRTPSEGRRSRNAYEPNRPGIRGCSISRGLGVMAMWPCFSPAMRERAICLSRVNREAVFRLAIVRCWHAHRCVYRAQKVWKQTRAERFVIDVFSGAWSADESRPAGADRRRGTTSRKPGRKLGQQPWPGRSSGHSRRKSFIKAGGGEGEEKHAQHSGGYRAATPNVV